MFSRKFYAYQNDGREQNDGDPRAKTTCRIGENEADENGDVFPHELQPFWRAFSAAGVKVGQMVFWIYEQNTICSSQIYTT